jgi:hypothetical protein
MGRAREAVVSRIVLDGCAGMRTDAVNRNIVPSCRAGYDDTVIVDEPSVRLESAVGGSSKVEREIDIRRGRRYWILNIASLKTGAVRNECRTYAKGSKEFLSVHRFL